MEDQTLMRIPKKLLKKLKKNKLCKRDSYANVIERLIQKDLHK